MREAVQGGVVAVQGWFRMHCRRSRYEIAGGGFLDANPRGGAGWCGAGRGEGRGVGCWWAVWVSNPRARCRAFVHGPCHMPCEHPLSYA